MNRRTVEPPNSLLISCPLPAEELPPRVTRYLYDGQAILATFTETGRERARYTHGPRIDEPLAELHRKQLTFYHADALGSIIALTDAQGRPLRAYHYQAFGLPEEARGDRQPFRFTGREWDKELGLYYYRARYYDPRAGRFLSEDPIGFWGGINPFTYVENAPVNARDPLGLAHEGFVQQLAQMADRSLGKTIRSLEGRIQEHLRALADASQQLAAQHHEHELRIFRQQLELARGEALRRGLKFGSGIVMILLMELASPAEANAGEEEMLEKWRSQQG